MFISADETLFRKILNNPPHVLFPLLPHNKELAYNLRPRAHQFILPISSIAAAKNLFITCYSEMHIDIDFDLIFLHRFTFVIAIVVNCKSYVFVIGLLTCLLNYLFKKLTSFKVLPSVMSTGSYPILVSKKIDLTDCDSHLSPVQYVHANWDLSCYSKTGPSSLKKQALDLDTASSYQPILNCHICLKSLNKSLLAISPCTYQNCIYFQRIFSYHLGSTDPCSTAVHMEPFSTSVFKVLI